MITTTPQRVKTPRMRRRSAPVARIPGKIIPSKLEINFGDKTSTVIYSKRQLARKTIARKAPEPRGTLKQQWKIIENGTITNYPPHTITLDIDNRTNTVIRKSDLAVVKQPLPSNQKQTSPPKRLMHMVACKSLIEYDNYQEKIKQFCLEEKRRAKQKQQSLTQGHSSSTTKTPTGDGELYSHEQLVSIAKNNQKQQQQKKRTQQKQKTPTSKKQPRQRTSPQRRKNTQWHKKKQN